MANQEEPDLLMFWKEGLDLLHQGVEVWNQWRKEHPDIMPILYEANFDTSNLNGINFSGAYLVGAHFKVAKLVGANLSRASLSRADLWGANLSGADLTGADLSGATLIRTNLSRATLVDCSVYGISVWEVQLEGAKQENLLVTDRGEPTVTVDNLEVAQFIYLLLNHKKLCDERPQDRNYTETVKTLAGLSRFIIADLSGPSVPQELYATVPHFKIPLVPIIEASRKPYPMAVDILEYPWVVRPPVTFATTEELLEQLPTKVLAPAEEKHQARQKLLDELFDKT